jgi:hypothetical protein
MLPQIARPGKHRFEREARGRAHDALRRDRLDRRVSLRRLPYIAMEFLAERPVPSMRPSRPHPGTQVLIGLGAGDWPAHRSGSSIGISPQVFCLDEGGVKIASSVARFAMGNIDTRDGGGHRQYMS